MKSKTICLLILILTLIIVMFPTISNAELIYQYGGDYSTVEESSTVGILNPYYYEPNKLQTDDVKGLEEFGGRIAGFIQVIGTILSVGTLMIIGIRYMVSSVEEKAEYKDRMIPYIIGAVLLFGASNIVNIIYVTFKNM